ncbi:WxL protein host-binding domain-containing protein [Latilactobacillus graminis]|uniref:DUF3324 domain-containing protein n=2 Tax=Latilactobacillus graminis TaxID=60519 RepID=A0AA89L4U8_9LACO|nr:DUF3324 domain-containing protein [Latilactobacillus graminis]KRM24471.1 hypothetical protein FC90_GL000175 [Latilactobacillus graminis DSM 20719]QFP79071.1 DUF3324 domain-containing protein [Latilactobacillus graminis]
MIKKAELTNAYKKNIWRVLLLIILNGLLLLSIASGSVSAKSHRIKSKVDNTVPMTVQVLPKLPPDNLGGRHLGYFVLPMVDHKERKETVRLYNPTNQTIKIRFKAADATTNNNGSVDYTGAHAVDHSLLKKPASSMIKVPQSLKLKPQAGRSVTFTVKNVADNFKGQKAAALNIIADGVNANRSSIRNRYVYAIGVVLQGEKLPKRQLQRLKVSGIDVGLTKAKKAAIRVKLANPDATYLKQTKLQVKLVNRKYHFFKYQDVKKDLKIAPNSSFKDDILLGGKRLVPGVYRLTMTAKTDRYHQTATKYVEITKNKARFINAHNYLYLKYRNRLLIGLLVLLIIVAALTIGLRRRFKRRKKDLNE